MSRFPTLDTEALGITLADGGGPPVTAADSAGLTTVFLTASADPAGVSRR